MTLWKSLASLPSSFPFLSYSPSAAEIVESVEKSLAAPSLSLSTWTPSLRVHLPHLNRAPQSRPRHRCHHHQKALGRGQIWVDGGRGLNLERERPFVVGALDCWRGSSKSARGSRSSSSSTELEQDSPTMVMGWEAVISPSFPRVEIQ
ncbi:unnamed protein product [Linum trigynum]|uniref:Uncharacterized protein n=1 Tax=Linum trigynum TaxID=586398 RepID=A0AAV2GT03_9ROSI